MKQNNHGFSLIETVVAMAILGAFTVSICTCLVLSLRMNEKTSTLMQEQMAVSSAVETLMATGIIETDPKIGFPYNYDTPNGLVEITIQTGSGEDYYDVTVTSKNTNGNPGNVTVTTQIREAVGTE